MDFSSRNPASSNALNLAARNNDVANVRRLLKKINPNCVDNRGWTCLHEAAYNDSYETMVLILKNRRSRPLVETHEGHTALYLACRNKCSLKTIETILETVEDIVNYGSTEGVTPLHVACGQGRVELIELLIKYGAEINVQDFDGDTPLHDAVLESQHNAVITLLHAGADPEIKNEYFLFTPFHLACCRGCLPIVESLYHFVTDINETVASGDSPLTLAFRGDNDDIIYFLLDNKADPHITNESGEMAIDIAVTRGCDTEVLKKLLYLTDREKINKTIIAKACKPHYFNFEVLEILLTSDLGPEFFSFSEPFDKSINEFKDVKYLFQTNSTLNSYLNICGYIYNQAPEKFREFFYLYLMRGVHVNATHVNECPPLVYAHYVNAQCFEEVFEILIEHGCNVDYLSDIYLCDVMPDAFYAALFMYPASVLVMLPYSLYCDPNRFLAVADDTGQLHIIPQQVQERLFLMIDKQFIDITAEALDYSVPCLQHLCRQKIRSLFKNSAVKIDSTQTYLRVLNSLQIPQMLKDYIRYKV